MTAVNPRTSGAAASSYSDRTADRLRAFLASMRPLRGCADLDDSDEYQRGRSLIERLAISARGSESDPPLRLTVPQCADVLAFIACNEPIEPAAWWDDPDGPSHLVGFYLLLRALEASLRLGREAQPIREIEKAVADVVTLAPPERKQLRRSLRELGRRP